MLKTSNLDRLITVPDAPPIPGLRFRGFRGEDDLPVMANVAATCNKADQVDYVPCAEELARFFRHPVNWDPCQDTLFVEMHAQMIAYSRVWWERDTDGTRKYHQRLRLLPEWRGHGLRRVMLRYNEARLREIAAGHSADVTRVFETGAVDTQGDWRALLISEGYLPARYFFLMVRPDLEDVPELPLPEGLEVRPATREGYETIRQAAREAFEDHWGGLDGLDEWLGSWPESPNFDPSLWQVAWAGDQAAGMVLNFIDEGENRAFNRKRGHTETICVRRPWRRRGLARALIARSFRVLKGRGMTEAALGVDAQNPRGALRLYESMGFRTDRRLTFFRKPLD